VTKKTTDGRRVRGTGSQQVFEALQRDILTLKLAPGLALDESSLAERFGTSRSPVREALIRLSAEGLVVASTNRATLVAPIDLETFPKYIEALDLLQRANTRLAAQLRCDDDIENIREKMLSFENAVRNNDHMEMSGTNRDFHLAVAKAGKNPFLTSQYGALLNSGRPPF
jgi:DNA-binding GntR family transcriptional regulator